MAASEPSYEGNGTAETGGVIDVAWEGNRLVLWMRGEHDAGNVHLVAESFATAGRMGASHVVVDLSGIRFMDGTVARALAAARSAPGLAGMSLRHPSPKAWRVLAVCGLDELVELAPPVCVEPVPPGGRSVRDTVRTSSSSLPAGDP